MRLNNGTTDPVDYDQSGGGTPLPEKTVASKTGTIPADSETPPFTPAGDAPYTVTFSSPTHKAVTSCPFSDGSATVTLSDDWTITVSSGCD